MNDTNPNENPVNNSGPTTDTDSGTTAGTPGTDALSGGVTNPMPENTVPDTPVVPAPAEQAPVGPDKAVTPEIPQAPAEPTESEPVIPKITVKEIAPPVEKPKSGNKGMVLLLVLLLVILGVLIYVILTQTDIGQGGNTMGPYETVAPTGTTENNISENLQTTPTGGIAGPSPTYFAQNWKPYAGTKVKVGFNYHPGWEVEETDEVITIKEPAYGEMINPGFVMEIKKVAIDYLAMGNHVPDGSKDKKIQIGNETFDAKYYYFGEGAPNSDGSPDDTWWHNMNEGHVVEWKNGMQIAFWSVLNWESVGKDGTPDYSSKPSDEAMQICEEILKSLVLL